MSPLLESQLRNELAVALERAKERDEYERKAQRLTGEVDTLKAAARVDMKLIRELQRDLSIARMTARAEQLVAQQERAA